MSDVSCFAYRQVCPVCGKVCDSGMLPGGGAVQPGIMMVCAYCTTLSRIDAGGRAVSGPFAKRANFFWKSRAVLTAVMVTHKMLDDTPHLDRRTPELIAEWRGTEAPEAKRQ